MRMIVIGEDMLSEKTAKCKEKTRFLSCGYIKEVQRRGYHKTQDALNMARFINGITRLQSQNANLFISQGGSLPKGA